MHTVYSMRVNRAKKSKGPGAFQSKCSPLPNRNPAYFNAFLIGHFLTSVDDINVYTNSFTFCSPGGEKRMLDD